MSKFSLASAAVGVVVVWCAAWAAAAPTTGKHLRVSLADVLTSAVCPLRVAYDEDANRVPRRIKEIKCAATPNPVCHEQGITHACCRSRHRNFSTECMEVTDTVLVRYHGSDDLVKHTVSVGCTCVFRPNAQAAQTPDHGPEPPAHLTS